MPDMRVRKQSKGEGQSVVISPHQSRTVRAVRNVTRWMKQGTEWTLVQKQEPVARLAKR